MNKPLINYYARIISRGDYKLDDVPDDMKDEVQKRIKELQNTEEKKERVE